MAKKKKKEESLPISAISVKGFKCFRDETEIELRPLTILAGANSSGKTSIMQPLLLMKQTLQCPWDPGPLLLEGPNANFTSVKQMLWRGQFDDGAKSFNIELSKGENLKVKQTFRRSSGKIKGFSLSSLEHFDNGKHIKWHKTMKRKELEDNIPEFLFDISRSISKDLNKDLIWYIDFERCIMAVSLKIRKSSHPIRFFKDFTFTPIAGFIPTIKDIIHLPGLRGNPLRVYPATSVGEAYSGVFQGYVASIIASWKDNNNERLEQLCNSLEKLGLTWRIESSYLSDTQIELLVGRLPTQKQSIDNDLVNIADVGFGVSQVLPVVLAMLVAEPGQLVFIEQPEIHLHPRARVILAELIAETAKRGVILIIETHCSIILKSIQTLVAKGELPEKLVKLHWFQRREDGSSEVKSRDLSPKGAYGDWPVDFGKVDLDVEQGYLEAVL
ncbi:MAG: AAA family ATPase [candidate division Zixibacteria bacterium]|nr:AAA family ATPase [Candidatus Tariuqbacter arcticus]